MRTIRRPFASLALPFALLFTLVGAASAHADITIISPAHSPEGYTNDLTPDVTFTGAAALGTVTLEVDEVVVGTTTAGITGAGTVSPEDPITSEPMDLNNRRFGLTVRDPGGTGAMQDTVTVNIDQVPTISGFNTPVLAADVSFSLSNAIPSNDFKLYIDGDLDSTPTADEDGLLGDIKPTGTLTAGSHSAVVTSLDDAGTESSDSEAFDFDVAPPAPAYTDLSQDYPGQFNQGRPGIKVEGIDPDATLVSLYEYDTEIGEWQSQPLDAIAPSSDDTATLTPTGALADGSHLLAITQTVNGVEGLTDDAHATVNVDVLTTAPVLERDFDGPLTSNPTPEFYATNTLNNYGDNTSTVRLYVDGHLVGQPEPAYTADGEFWVIPDGPIADGEHSAYVVTVDDLGNESPIHSNSVAFTVDTVGPAAPTVVSPANGSTTATSLPVVTVTTEPGALAHVLVDDVGEESYQTADANGNVTFTLTSALVDGGHALHVYSRDVLGNYGDMADTTFTVSTPKAPPVVTPPPPVVTPPVTTAPKNPTDVDGDGIDNNWLVGGKAAPAPATPKAKVSAGKVELKLTAVPKGATKVRVYRADGKGGYKLVKTLSAKSKTFTDKTVKGGHTYKYKTVGVNAKGQQGTASKPATAKVKKK